MRQQRLLLDGLVLFVLIVQREGRMHQASAASQGLDARRHSGLDGGILAGEFYGAAAALAG
jgi:hypothetical protein